MQSNFLLGALKISDGARAALRRIPHDLIARHAINEHGSLSIRERRCNEVGMKTLGEIISRYPIDPTDPSLGHVMVVTEAHWGETAVVLEEEIER